MNLKIFLICRDDVLKLVLAEHYGAATASRSQRNHGWSYIQLLDGLAGLGIRSHTDKTFLSHESTQFNNDSSTSLLLKQQTRSQ